METGRSGRDHRVVGEVLRALRQEAGLTQVGVAERLGRPQSFVSKYEAGERRLDLLQLMDVARAVESHVTEIVKRLEAARHARR